MTHTRKAAPSTTGIAPGARDNTGVIVGCAIERCPSASDTQTDIGRGAINAGGRQTEAAGKGTRLG